METNIIAQKFASFNVCVYLSTQIWGSKVCPSVLFWVKWFRWKTGWFSSLLKLLHMFTHETGSLLHRGTVHLLTASHKWEEGASGVKIQNIKLTASSTAFLNETVHFPHVEWWHFLDLHWRIITFMPTLLLYTVTTKNKNNFEVLASKTVFEYVWYVLDILPESWAQSEEWWAYKHSGAERGNWLLLFPL